MRFLFAVLKKYAFVFLFIFLEILSFIWLLNQSSYHRSVFSESAMDIVGVFSENSDKLFDYTHLIRANEKLLAENAMLNQKLMSYISQYQKVDDAINITIDTIRYTTKDSLYHFKYIYEPIDIIHNSVAYHDNYIMIDKGKQNQVDKDMGLVGTKGVLGIIVKSSQHYSWVMSLLNGNMKLTAKLKDNQMGSIMWKGNDYRVGKMMEVPAHVNLKAGDTIFTSGYSQIFPENIPIGIVKDFEIKLGSDVYDITFSYIEDFNQLDMGYVIKNVDRKEIDSLLIKQ